MLLHLLSVAMGFVAIILLLSIAVTGLVEAAQSAVRLRSKLLRDGLAELFAAATSDAIESVDEKIGALQKEYPNLVPRRRISREQVRTLAGLVKPEWATQGSEEIDRLFKLMELRTSEVFRDRLRIINILAGFVVAFVFQASAFDLFSRLNSDAVFLRQAVSIGFQLDSTGSSDSAEPPAGTPALEDPGSPDGASTQRELLGLRPWPDGGYFVESLGSGVSRLLGVLFTGLLLSLGAPFWFDVLSGLVGLLRSQRARAASD